jgi:hypothetical protein
MVEHIGPVSQPLHSHKAGPDVPVLAKHMKEQVSTMADQLQKLMEDPSLASHSSFLDEFAKNASKLNKTVDQASTLR